MSLSLCLIQLVRHLAYLLSGQGQYDEALKLGREVRYKLELAFTFETSDRLNELERIMREYVTLCTHNVPVLEIAVENVGVIESHG